MEELSKEVEKLDKKMKEYDQKIKVNEEANERKQTCSLRKVPKQYHK